MLLDGELYLFDTRLGLPSAGPDGKPVATLRDVLADEKRLRAMDLEMGQPQPRLYPMLGRRFGSISWPWSRRPPTYMSRPYRNWSRRNCPARKL